MAQKKTKNETPLKKKATQKPKKAAVSKKKTKDTTKPKKPVKTQNKPKENKGAKLTDKQLRFCEEFVIDWNATAAARRAGYSKASAENIGWENMRKPQVQEKIAELAAGISQRAGLSAEWVIEKLMEIVDRSMAGQVKTDRKGDPVVIPYHDKQFQENMTNKAKEKNWAMVWEFDTSGANRALELLGKYLKMFTDKVEHSGKVEGGKVVVLPGNGRDVEQPAETPEKK